ncbi:MAG TPA: hypothetical protein VMV81_14035 [Phycisphaerae bacterium]|nr:hypothetical protein [Phycisphaerae bacterium]
MSVARFSALLLTAVFPASCQRAERPPDQKPSQGAAVKPCDDFTVRQDSENELATLRALDSELTADLESKRKHADELMRAGQDEKATKAAFDDLLESQEQLLKVKERRLQVEQTLREVNNPDRVANAALSPAEYELATLRALVTELSLDLDAKKALYDAVSKARPEDLPVPSEVKAGGQSMVLKYQSDQIEKTRRDYLEAREQFRTIRARLGEAELQLKELNKRSDTP